MFMYTMFLDQPFEVDQPVPSLSSSEPIVTTNAYMVLPNENQTSHSAPVAQPSLFSIDGTPVGYSVVGSIVDYSTDLTDIEDLTPVDWFTMQANENHLHLIGGTFYQHLWIIQLIVTDPFWVNVLTLYAQMYTILLVFGLVVGITMMIDLYINR